MSQPSEDTILAIETSSGKGGVAVVRNGECVFEESFKADRSHNSRLFPPLEAALKVCREAGGPAWIVTGRGPGSYAGVRVAMAAAQGLSLSTGAGVFGLPSLCALQPDAAGAPAPASHLAIGNARRGDWFLARVDDGRLTRPPELVKESDMAGKVDAARREENGADAVLTLDPGGPVEDAAPASPDARKLALVAARLSTDEREALAREPLEPIYLHRPFVTRPKG